MTALDPTIEWEEIDGVSNDYFVVNMGFVPYLLSVIMNLSFFSSLTS